MVRVVDVIFVKIVSKRTVSGESVGVSDAEWEISSSTQELVRMASRVKNNM